MITVLLSMNPAADFPFLYVVVIDDDDIDRFILQKMLESLKFAKRVSLFPSASSALEQFRKDQDLPEVIFLDLNMPLVDGFEFMKIIKEQFSDKIKDCKIVAITCSIDKMDEVRVKGLIPHSRFFQKPVTTDMLKMLAKKK
jgi:CheY-like chemotaxis protein